jgi:NAD-specific glutamate dehydrogenase
MTGVPLPSRHDTSHVRELESLGAPPRAATVLASLARLEIVPAAARLADEVGRPARSVSVAFEPIVHRLGIDRLRRLAEAARAEGRWAHAAGQGLLLDLATIRDDATSAALLSHPDVDERAAVDAWLASNRDAVADATRVRREVEADHDGGEHRLDGIAVAVRALRRVVG